MPPPPRGRSRTRRRPPLQSQQKVMSPLQSRNNSREPLYRTTSLETRSRTPSPHGVTSPTQSQLEYYGSVNLTDRSRSPSPDTARKTKAANKTRGTRKLPAIPQKPHTLNLPKKHLESGAMPQMLPSPTMTKSASSINFPQLNASPTHRPHMPTPSRGRRERSMSPRRRHAYSPTDARDLADGMYAARDRSGRSDRLYSSQMLNNSSSYADHRYTPPHRGAPDNRYSDANRRGDDIQVVRVAGRQVPSGLPNGYKPGQGSGRTPDLHLRKQVQPAPPPDEQSDSEDEDWC
ncbi:hypothetical protein NP493_6830g00000 [Ridgeia piscesae]|nr:hypothetical protein NP493_6830g00000 [Ridgeia piscesae]